MRVMLFKLRNKAGRCWYATSPNHNGETKVLAREQFEVPNGFEVVTQVYNGYAEDTIYHNGKPKVIHTDINTGCPYMLIGKKRKLDGKTYGTTKVNLIPIDKE